MSHGPIEEKHKAIMNALAKDLNRLFNGEQHPPKYGFALLIFDLDSNDGRMNYISNAQRQDMLVAMKEFIANNEGRVHQAGGKH